jgi:hypothetical protein
VENFVASRDDPAPIVEREFRDVQSGEKRPENETLRAEDHKVTPKQAANRAPGLPAGANRREA